MELRKQSVHDGHLGMQQDAGPGVGCWKLQADHILVGLTALHHPAHLLMFGFVAGAVFKACQPLSDESAEALMRGLFDLTPVLDPVRSKSARADPLKRQYLELSANPCCRRFLTSTHRLPLLQRRLVHASDLSLPWPNPCHAAPLSFACPPFVDISTVDQI